MALAFTLAPFAAGGGAGAGGEALAQEVPTPTIAIGDQAFPTIAEAVAAAVSGDTIVVGPGRLVLAAPISLAGGISLAGASARETQLDASGLDAGVQIASGGGDTTRVSGLEIFGAGRGIDVGAAQRALIRNVVVRNNEEVGVRVAEDADLTLVSCTLVGNGTGVAVVGTARVRNTIITGGNVGLSAARLGGLVSSYNDLFGNAGGNYDHVERGKGDVTFAAAFLDQGANDFRLIDAQPVTDRGDPADAFSEEPAPNGGRINLGAFGNTAEAELSRPAATTGGGGCSFGGPGGDRGARCLWTTLAFAIVSVVLTRSGRRPVRCRCRASTTGCRT